MSSKRADVALERDHIDTAFNWDDVRLFLILARTGSLRRAAAEAAMSRSALMRHILTSSSGPIACSSGAPSRGWC